MNTKTLKTGLAILMILTVSACSAAKKPSAVTTAQIQTDATSISFIKARFSKVVSLNIISEPIQGTQCLAVADLTYDNGDALISGQVVINYNWSNNRWKAANAQFSLKEVSAKAEAPDADIILAAGAIDALNTEYQAGAFSAEASIVSRTADLKHGLAAYVVTRSVSVDNWTALTTYKISAKYENSLGWIFNVASWTYKETTDWSGTWAIQWQTYPNETQYQPNEKMNLTVTGSMVLTNDSTGNQNESRNVTVSFNRLKSPYMIPARLSRDYESDGLYSTRLIVIKYGNKDNDQFNLELRFDLSGSVATASYVAKSFDGNLGVLTKIR